MDAAVGVITALFPTEPILHKLGVIPFKYGNKRVCWAQSRDPFARNRTVNDG